MKGICCARNDHFIVTLDCCRLSKLLTRLMESIPQNVDRPHVVDYATAQDVTLTVGHDHVPTRVAVPIDQ